MRLVIPFLLLMPSLVAAAEPGLITSWRGSDGQGVMPAREVVHGFAWIDDDAKLPEAIDKRVLGGPTTLSEKPGARTNACWRVPLPAWGYSAPVAVGDKVGRASCRERV